MVLVAGFYLISPLLLTPVDTWFYRFVYLLKLLFCTLNPRVATVSKTKFTETQITRTFWSAPFGGLTLLISD